MVVGFCFSLNGNTFKTKDIITKTVLSLIKEAEEEAQLLLPMNEVFTMD